MKDKMAKLIEITGKALSGEWGNDDNTGNGIPVLRTTNFTNEGIVNYNNVVTRIIEKKKIEEKYLRKGDIVIEKSGGSDKQPVGRVVYFDGPENTYLFNNFTGLLRVKDQAKWYPRYVFYSLFSNYHRGGTRAFQNKTTGLHNLKIDDFVSRCEVTEAGINEQIAACKRMDRVNDIIRMHQQQLQKLDELVKARFVELFGDPVLNQHGWRKVALEVNATLLNGRAYKQDELLDSGKYPVLRVGNFFSNRGWYYSDLELDDDKYCDNGDLLYAWSASFGPQIWNGGKVIYHYHIWKVLVGEAYNRQFLCKLLEYATESLMGDTHGIAMMHLTKSGMEKTEFIVPPIERQERFAAFVEQTDKSKVAVQKALDEAQLLFDSLMQKYFG